MVISSKFFGLVGTGVRDETGGLTQRATDK